MTEFCTPDGMPRVTICLSIGRSKRTLRRVTLYIVSTLISLRKASAALRIWLMMVASAALATPQWNTATNSRSSTMLVSEAVIRYFIGLRLSPTDCRMLAPTLYRITATEPRK